MNEHQIQFNELLLEEMEHRVVSVDLIEFNDKDEPVDRLNNQFITLRSDYIKGELPTQKGDSETITAWDILKEDWVEIPSKAILKYTGHQIPKKDIYEGGFDEDDSGHLEYINQVCDNCKPVIEELCNDPECDHDHNALCDKLYKYGLRMLEAQQIFKFKISEDRLIQGDVDGQPDLTDDELEICRECWMDYIRKHRETAFEELDQLEEEAKKEGSSEEDLADIDIIKQMFRDIPQDTDLSQYKSLHELAEFWPSLLLPGPNALPVNPVGKFHFTPESLPEPLSDQPEQSVDVKAAAEKAEAQIIEEEKEGLRLILAGITDVDELTSLLAEVKDQEGVPDYAIAAVESRVKELEK